MHYVNYIFYFCININIFPLADLALTTEVHQISASEIPNIDTIVHLDSVPSPLSPQLGDSVIDNAANIISTGNNPPSEGISFVNHCIN